MKIEFRIPGLKESLKARAISKHEKQLESAIDPTYGKKGVSWFKNPKRTLYNKIYNKTIKSIFDIFK